MSVGSNRCVCVSVHGSIRGSVHANPCSGEVNKANYIKQHDGLNGTTMEKAVGSSSDNGPFNTERRVIKEENKQKQKKKKKKRNGATQTGSNG